MIIEEKTKKQEETEQVYCGMKTHSVEGNLLEKEQMLMKGRKW